MKKSRNLTISRAILLLFIALLLSCAEYSFSRGGNAGGGRNTAALNGIFFALEADFDQTDQTRYSLLLEFSDNFLVDVEFNAAPRTADTTFKIAGSSAAINWRQEAEALEERLTGAGIDSIEEIIADSDERFKNIINALLLWRLQGGANRIDADYFFWRGLGIYQNGFFENQAANADENGWIARQNIAVDNGYIIAADWNPIDGKGDDKRTASKEDRYFMNKFGEHTIPEVYWWQQAQATEKYLLFVQDPVKISYSDDEGNSDAITQATIAVDDFFLGILKAIRRR